MTPDESDHDKPSFREYRISSITNRKESFMLPEKQDRTFGEFYKSARYNKILDEKTTLFIHLATAMSVACYP